MSFYDETFLPLCIKMGKRPGTVAAELGYSRAMISKWKSRGGRPSETTLMDLAAYFGLSLDEIVRSQVELLDRTVNQQMAAVCVYDLGAEYHDRTEMRQDTVPRINVLMSQLDPLDPGGWIGICVTSNDLYPKYVQGDCVIFQETRTIRPIYYGQPFAFLLDGVLRIGTFMPGKERAHKISFYNSNQAPVVIGQNEKDRLAVLGRECLLLRWNR